LRKKLEEKLVEKLKQVKVERRKGAVAVLDYVAKLYREKQKRKNQSSMSIYDVSSEYVTDAGLKEESVRKRMIEKAELKLRTRMTERLIAKSGKHIVRP